MNNVDFCYILKELICSFNYNDPFTVVGDLNMDLLVRNNNKLEIFIKNNKFCNYDSVPTRIATIRNK
jgi:hypothetical protein